MITIYKTENITRNKEGRFVVADIRCLSTDTKPTEIEGKNVANGSQLVEIDTGKVFLYDLDSETWKEI